jgi:hypothetical protein
VATIERIKTHLIDATGCGIGAFDQGPVAICRNVALAVSGNATIIGTDRRTTPGLASFANGAAFRYFDFNDHIPMAQTRVQTPFRPEGSRGRRSGAQCRLRRTSGTWRPDRPAPIFEGQSGFFKQVSGPGDVDLD